MTTAASPDPIRVGVIGAGSNTKLYHIPNLQKHAGVTVEVVCNRTVESAQAVAKEFGIPKVASHMLGFRKLGLLSAVSEMCLDQS